jgi:hypothetical protein
VKPLAELTVEDLAASPIWRYVGGTGAEALVARSKRTTLSQSDDEIFLAATEFVLSDQSRHTGFCFPADDSGIDYLQPVIIDRSGHVSFWFDGPASEAALAAQWKAFGREPRDVFPAEFRCLVPVDKRVVSGRIEAIASSEDLSAELVVPPLIEDDERVLTARPVQVRRDTGPVEKRAARRRKAELPVEFTQGNVHGSGTTADLSARGMFVRASQAPPTGPKLRLKVNLPAGRTLTLEGRVVRGCTTFTPAGNASGFGVRLSEESQDYEDLVARLKRKPR